MLSLTSYTLVLALAASVVPQVAAQRLNDLRFRYPDIPYMVDTNNGPRGIRAWLLRLLSASELELTPRFARQRPDTTFATPPLRAKSPVARLRSSTRSRTSACGESRFSETVVSEGGRRLKLARVVAHCFFLSSSGFVPGQSLIQIYCRAPPELGVVGDTEGEMVAWCTRPGRGTRLIPEGALKGVQFMKVGWSSREQRERLGS